MLEENFEKWVRTKNYNSIVRKWSILGILGFREKEKGISFSIK